MMSIWFVFLATFMRMYVPFLSYAGIFRKIVETFQNYDWLGFLGSFLGGTIGGLATLYGVVLTIKVQKKTEDEKQRLSIIPIIEYAIKCDETIIDNSKGQLEGEVIPCVNVEGVRCDGKETEKWYFDLVMHNNGLGTAQVSEIQFVFKDGKTSQFLWTGNYGYSYKLLKVNSKIDCRYEIYAPKYHFYKAEKPSQDFLYQLECIVKYEDLMGNKYQQKVHASIFKAVLELHGQTTDWNTCNLQYYEKYITI